MRLNLTSMAAAVVIAAVYLHSNPCAAAQSASRPTTSEKGTTNPAQKDTTRPAAKPRVIPFRGTLKSCNASAGTVVVGTRTFVCTRDTKIFRGGKTAPLTEARVGEIVTGSYRKTEDGKLMAASVYLGGKNPSAAKKNSTRTPREKLPPSTDEVEE